MHFTLCSVHLCVWTDLVIWGMATPSCVVGVSRSCSTIDIFIQTLHTFNASRNFWGDWGLGFPLALIWFYFETYLKKSSKTPFLCQWGGLKVQRGKLLPSLHVWVSDIEGKQNLVTWKHQKGLMWSQMGVTRTLGNSRLSLCMKWFILWTLSFSFYWMLTSQCPYLYIIS